MNLKYKIFYFIFTILICSNYNLKTNNSKFDFKKHTRILSSAGIIGVIGYTGYQYTKTPTYPNFMVHRIADQVDFFPENFSWGVATASTQNEETSHNNSWSVSYLQDHKKYNLTPAKDCCKSWSQWQDDIDKAAFLGVNSYRLSIEWSRVQPTSDTFDTAAIDHYIEICKALRAKGITPMICLHHYSDPIWFLELGGFSKKENIDFFIRFSQKMYEALNQYVGQWIVISQPVAYALKGYAQAMQPPFIKDSSLADIVILNILNAHIQVYDMMHDIYKKTEQGLKPSVGICHQITQMKAYTSYSPLDHLTATFADRIYNKSFTRFFTTGHLRTLKPMVDIAYIPQAPTKFDFFALSYYSPKSFTGMTAITPQAEQSHQTADVSRIIDKDGMYDAIVQAAQLGKPVYVVESGINPVDENQRILLLDSYLSAIHEAMIHGYDVRGYYHWTLMDNYEWGKPFNSTHFGLYKNRIIDPQGTLDINFTHHNLMLKDSGKYYKTILLKQKK